MRLRNCAKYDFKLTCNVSCEKMLITYPFKIHFLVIQVNNYSSCHQRLWINVSCAWFCFKIEMFEQFKHLTHQEDEWRNASRVSPENYFEHVYSVFHVCLLQSIFWILNLKTRLQKKPQQFGCKSFITLFKNKLLFSICVLLFQMISQMNLKLYM